jgi:hypothetical protein
VGLKLNGTNQFLTYADDVNLQRDNTRTIKKSIEILIDASKELVLEKTKRIKYIVLSLHRNAGQNRNIKIGNRSFENLA